MVELVTRMLELKKQQARAPKKQSPSARQLLDQKFAITDKQIDPSSGDTIKDYDKFRGHNKRLWMAAYLTLPARHDKMVEMVETMLKLHKDLPKAKTPHEQESIQRQIAATDRQIDVLVYELYGLTKDEIRIVEGG
jgi:hypothetical protein